MSSISGTSVSNAPFSGFVQETRLVNGVDIAFRKGGQGEPLLLLHGHPQTHFIWHKVAEQLAKNFTVIAPDLRGYGDSGKPAGVDGHSNYSKRTMARDQIELMQSLGYAKFKVLAHDRGARVAHRLAVDYPAAVDKLILLDIAPTLAMYEQTSQLFATKYWHWFFLIQPAPFPEQLIQSDPDFYISKVMGNRSAGLSPFTAEAFEQYQRCLKLPGAIHAMCEDYRAAATIDLEHDRADREIGRKIQCPTLILWGANGVIQMCFDAVLEWRRVAQDVRGHSLPCGHYVPEEAPTELLHDVEQFFRV
jgi:haloacetate dehalogenase